MTIELFKGEDNLLLSILAKEYKQMGLDEMDKAKAIYRLMERIELTQRLYNNMYRRSGNNGNN